MSNKTLKLTLIGDPKSGKTTMLKSIAKHLSTLGYAASEIAAFNGYEKITIMKIPKEMRKLPVAPHVQPELMKFDPQNGSENPYPSEAAQYRKYHGEVAWIWNPWTGKPRSPQCIGSDTFGHLIHTPTENGNSCN